MNEVQKLFKQIKTRQQGEEVLRGLGPSSRAGEEFGRLLSGARSVGLTLAFYPSEAVLSKIIDWFEDNLSERPIIDLSVDPDIVGGAKVLCNEHFKDYSLRSIIEKMGLIGDPHAETEEVI